MKKLLVVLLGVLLLLPFSASAADLKYGMKNNEEVRQVQQYLKDGGYYKGDVTGNFYSVTLAAVKKFQKENKLKVTGIWNQLSQDKKDELLAIHNDVYEQIAEVSNIPIGWIANGDGTFSPPPTVVNYPQAVASVWTPPEQVVYGTVPMQDYTVGNQIEIVNQPIQAENKREETKNSIPATPNNSVSPTSPTPIVPVSVMLESTISNFGKHAVYPLPLIQTNGQKQLTPLPFYYFVNCDPNSTDNTFSIDKFDSSIDGHSIITSNLPDQTIASFTLNDRAIFGNEDPQLLVNHQSHIISPKYWDYFLKAPKITSITFRNLGTVDLTKLNLNAEVFEPVVGNFIGIERKQNGKPMVLPSDVVSSHPNNREEASFRVLPRSVTTDSVTFDFPHPIITSAGSLFTNVGLRADLDKIKKLETINFQVVDVQLQNNDITKNYTVRLPSNDQNGRVIKKCDVRF